jgi:hypothetical protein
MFQKPWKVVYTDFGESMGYDSRSRIVDADGKPIAVIGTGEHCLIAEHEAVAAEIVCAVNRVAVLDAAEEQAGYEAMERRERQWMNEIDKRER